MLPQCAAVFNFMITSNATPARYLGSDGIVKTREIGVTSELARLRLTIEDIDFVSLMTAYGEFAIFAEGITIGNTITVCPVTATTYVNPYILDDDATYVFNETDKIIMTKVVGAPANKNEYAVDSSNNRVEFHTDLIGKVILICGIDPNKKRGEIGNQNTFLLADDFSFQGIFETTTPGGPYFLSIPHLERVSNPIYTHGGEGMVIEFVAIEGNDVNNRRRPFRIYSEKPDYSRVL